VLDKTVNRRHIGKILIVSGLILIVMGLVFTAQSKSVIGPEVSFMYNNPEWTVNGFMIAAIGIIVLGCGGGILLWYSKKDRKSSL
jgi:NhaP-type Na+/H+ or K+/H+ antiporter